MTPWRQEVPPAEAGFALIEVLVSAIVVLTVSAGTFGLLQAMTHASGEQRHGSQAFAIAQEDQARLRSMQLTALSNLDEKRSVTLAGTSFTVRSIGVFINNKTSSVSCAGTNISADYAQVTSIVTWPGMAGDEKSVLRSIVSPTNNSLDSASGALPVSVTNELGDPKAGVDLKAGIYSAETNAQGCATFPSLPEGSATLESNGQDANLVSPNSIYVEKTQAGIVIGAPKVTKLIYDSPGSIPVKFKYRVGSKTEFKPASADSVVAFHSVMKEARVSWTPDGTRQPVVEAYPLFPFTSPYSVYAGSCTANNPGTGAGQGSAIVPAGKASGSVELQLPALEVTVKEGSKAIKGAKVTITDKSCKDPKGNLVKRIYTTNSEGKQFTTGSPTEATEPGIPWGSYEVCASATVGGQLHRKKGIAVTAQSLTSATTLTVDLNSGTWESKVECT